MKRFLCGVFVVIITLIFTTTQNVSAQTPSVWNGSSIDTAWYHNHRDASEFTIYTAAEFAGFAKLVNTYETFAGKTVYVGNGIDQVVIDLNNKTWTEIGTGYLGLEFQGHFDGRNCIIKNLVVSPTTWKSYKGLFGYVVSTESGSAIVENVNVEGRVISNFSEVGGIVGNAKGTSAHRTIIRNCTFNGEVTSVTYSGGIVGDAEAYCDIINCAVAGTITSLESYAGGITARTTGGGDASTYNQITGCTNAAWVHAPENVGGITGYTNLSTITYCNNGGCVFGNYTAGGITGNRTSNSIIKYCISTGTISTGTNGSTIYGGNIIGANNRTNTTYCYYDKQRSRVGGVYGADYTNVAEGKHTSDLTVSTNDEKPAALAGTESEWTSHFTFIAGYYPIPANISDKTVARLAALPIGLPGSPLAYYNEPADFTLMDGYTYTSSNTGIVDVSANPATIGSTEGTAIITATSGEWSKVFVIEKPYTTSPVLTIATLSELENFRNAVNDGARGSYQGVSAYNGFKGITIQITADIDMSPNSNWTPIGTNENPFCGTIDGQNKLLKNIKVNRTNHNSGLFGVVNNAKIRNIKLTGNVTSSTLYLGGFCGRTRGTYADSVEFKNCHFYGKINASSQYTGGIIGYAGAYCVVENCSAGGEITSTSSYCGGIIGQNGGSARIANCINIAEIKANNYAGGIIGYVQNGTKIHDCLNSGNVYGTSENTGGITAFIGNNGSEIVNCINTGTVSSGGSIAGVRASGYNPTFTNNYYDRQRSVIGGVTNEDISGKAEGKTTSEILALTSGTLSDHWNFTGTSYPTPKNVGCGLSDDAVNNLVKIAAATVTFAGSEIYSEVEHNFTVASGFTWSSSNTRLITISGTSANLVHSDPYGSVVLTAKIDDLEDIEYTKKVLTSVLGEHPYDITSYADLCAFRDAVNAGLEGSYKGLMNMDGYCGKTFNLTNNITIEDTWTPIGITSTNPFRGNFNGNNHTISDLNVSSNVAYSGLFGYIYVSCGTGGIKDLVVEGNVRGTSYVGGIVGFGRGLNSTTYFTIENCHFKGSVIASSSYSGGVCGCLGAYSTAKESTATGDVTSTSSYVGGIVGKSSGDSNSSLSSFCTFARDSVLNCANNAKVTGSSYVGGICGYNYMSEVRYCLNAGEVITTSGTATSIGGIVGYNDVYRAYVAQCLNVYGFNSKEGNIIGVDNDTITNCPERGSLSVNRNYFDLQQCALGIVTASNGTGKLTSELVATTDGTKPSALSEFTNGKWWYKRGYYPMPINPANALASTPVLLAATPIMLDVDAGEAVAPTNTNQLTTRDFNVTVANGQVWTVSDDSKIIINGSTGAAHIANQFMRLTITATIGSYSKTMFLANTTYVPPIAIRSQDELKDFRDAVNSGNNGMFEARVYDLATHTVTAEVVEAYNVNGYKGVDFYLTSNIEGLENVDWTAIGTALHPFKGNFHGQGKKITNLRTSGSYTGLFGYIEESSIDSLTIQGRAYINSSNGTISNDNKINGSSYVAGLVGFAKKSVISQCHVSAVINNTGSYTGGICAEAVASTIKECDFCGKINSSVDYAGGICGHAAAEDNVGTKIISCTNAASVTAANYVGGIVGACENNSEVKFCNNGGNVSATTENAGGVCGTLNASTITSCIATGGVNMGGPIVGSTEGDVTVTSCYFDRQRCDRTDSRATVYDKYTSEMQGTALQSALGNTEWTFTASLYPMPKNLATQTGAKLAAIPLTLDKRGDASTHQTYRLVSQNFDLVSGTGMTWKTNCVRNEETGRTFLTINSSNVPTVNGDEKDCANIFLKLTDNYHVKTFFIQNPETQDPIPISTLTEFIKFRNAVNAGETGSYKGIMNESGFAGKNFRLDCDIDLAQSTYPTDQKAQTSNVNIKDDFLPIGTGSTCPFKGNFDGDNHTISNLKINGNGSNNNVPTSYKAVFGYVLGSTIKNLNVRGNISCASYAAGICAYIRGAESSNYSQIINCSFIGEVESTGSYVGGICGYANNYTNIIDCEVSGRVAGGSTNIGSIVGYSGGTDDARNYIENCINVANVGGSSSVGGICGQISKADIMYCINGGNVSGTSYSTAGIVGYNGGYALYCLNTGNVNTGASISGGNNYCQYCYYDKTKSTVLGVSNSSNVSSDTDGAAIGLTPQQIVGNTPTGLSGTNWNDTYWTFADDRYPVPAGHTSDIAMVSAIPIYLNDPTPSQVWNNTHANFMRSGEYTWTSSFPGYVNVTSTDVAVDAEADPETDICTSIVTVEKGDAKKKFIITSKEPPTDLDINNEADLIAFRNAVNNRDGGKYKGVLNTNGYMGITFHIKNNITITESDAWEAIGSVPAAFFAGNIDGENHTVSEVNFSTTANPVKYYGGFIGKITGGYVKDLTVEMKSAGSGVPNVTKETGYFGGICASIEGVSALQMGEIENCTFVGDSIYSNTQANGAGGICGYAGGWSRITDCTNRASIAGRTNTGGIIGYMGNTSPTLPYDNVINCENTGTIGIAGGGGSYLGGICGQYYSAGNINNCKNRGNIKVNAYGGGIVGRTQGKNSLTLATITNCENFGDVRAASNDSYSGGIVGFEYSYSAIKNTTNSGNVTGKSRMGGIVGWSQSLVVDNENLISNCANSGSVEGTSYVGGICGKGERTVICYTNNGANVTGTTASTTGGIVGDSDENSTVKVNIATGTVENGSSICGTSKGNLANNVYDMQRSKGKGLGATDDESGVAEGKKTSQLTGSALTGTIWTENFVANDGYPIPKGTDSKIGSILASAAATFNASPEVEIYDSILNDFTVTTLIGEEPITWSVEEPTNIEISGSTATIHRTCEVKEERIIYAENGGEKKAIKVTLAELLPPDLTGTDTEKTTCMGQSVDISTVADADYTYDWEGTGVLTDGAATATVLPTEATTYTVLVTNASTCTATATVDVNVEGSPSITDPTANDYIWTGGASINWDNRYNWVTYDSENSKYVQAANYPNATTHNVFVEQYGSGEGCIHNWTTANQTISVNNVTIGENAAVNVSNDKTLNMSGNVTIGTDATLSADGTVVFAGTAVQTISGDGSLNFNNVTFNNANGINATSLSSPIKIAGTATFTSGIVHGNVYFDKIATYNVDGVNSSKFVDGEVTKKMVGGDEFIFPVGAMVGEGQIAKFKATTANATDLTVRYDTDNQDFEGMPDWWKHDGNMDGSSIHLDHVSDREYWIVGSTDATTLSTVQLYWDGSGSTHSFDTNEDGGPDNFDYLRLAYANEGGFVWTGLTTSYEGTYESGYATATTGNIPFSGTRATDRKIVTFASTKAKELLLPIELVEFSAHCNGNLVEISWATASERNNNHFVVEKSYDAVKFAAIAQVAGAGNSIERIDYGHTDNDYYGGDVYYRLYQVDYDGTRTYSEIISVSCNDTENDPNVSIFPNPFSSDVTIVLEHFRNEPATIEIYDVMGKAIKYVKVESTYNEYETTLNLEELPAGIYTVRVSTSSATLNRQITKR